MKNFTKYFATLFGIGFISIAPGTLGSLFAIFIWYIFIDLFSIFYFVVLFLFVLSVSFYFTDIYLNNYKKSDPPEVIVDEFLGQSIPLLFIVKFNVYEVFTILVTLVQKTSSTSIAQFLVALMILSIINYTLQ